MSLATVASVVGIAAGANSLLNSGSGGGSGAGSHTYTPTGSGTADTTWQSILQQLTGGSTAAANAIDPAIAQAFAAMMGIPTGGLTDAGRRQGDYYGNLASNQDAMHNIMAQFGNQAGAAGNQIWNTALDPQNALRNRLYTQTQDASRAGTSARGIGMGAEAAGIENQDLSNFMMNWQDRQLGRQATGLEGMTRAFGQAGNDFTGASNLATSAAGNIGQSALAPYNMNVMAAGAPFNYAGLYNTAQGGTNQNLSAIMSQIIPYLYAGQGASGQNFQQGQYGLNNLISSLGRFPGFGGGGGNSPYLPYMPPPDPTGGMQPFNPTPPADLTGGGYGGP